MTSTLRAVAHRLNPRPLRRDCWQPSAGMLALEATRRPPTCGDPIGLRAGNGDTRPLLLYLYGLGAYLIGTNRTDGRRCAGVSDSFTHDDGRRVSGFVARCLAPVAMSRGQSSRSIGQVETLLIGFL